MNSSATCTSLRRYFRLPPIAALLCCLLLAPGCSRGPVLSPGAYELVKAVDNLCNLRSAEQLGKARSIIGERQSAGEISLDEQQMLNDILDLADQGHWDTAIARCRQLLVAQIDR